MKGYDASHSMDDKFFLTEKEDTLYLLHTYWKKNYIKCLKLEASKQLDVLKTEVNTRGIMSIEY